MTEEQRTQAQMNSLGITTIKDVCTWYVDGFLYEEEAEAMAQLLAKGISKDCPLYGAPWQEILAKGVIITAMLGIMA